MEALARGSGKGSLGDGGRGSRAGADAGFNTTELSCDGSLAFFGLALRTLTFLGFYMYYNKEAKLLFRSQPGEH